MFECSRTPLTSSQGRRLTAKKAERQKESGPGQVKFHAAPGLLFPYFYSETSCVLRDTRSGDATHEYPVFAALLTGLWCLHWLASCGVFNMERRTAPKVPAGAHDPLVTSFSPSLPFWMSLYSVQPLSCQGRALPVCLCRLTLRAVGEGQLLTP